MKRAIEENLVIRPKRSRKSKILKFLLVAVFSVVVVLCSIYAGYFYGVGQKDRDALTIKELRSELSELQEKYDELLIVEAKLNQSESVQKSAYKELETNYELVEQRNEFLNRRVNFYRSILSPEDGISGVRIHDVALRKEKEILYFDIVLIQSINHEKEATARVFVEIFESKDDRMALDNWKVENNDFQFKFSDTASGSIPLAADSNVNFLKVVVLPDGDSSKRIVEWYKV